jgi:hypothetical protein
MSLDVARDRETRPGTWVTALLEARAINEDDLAFLTRRRVATIYRWKRNGIDYISWVGVLALLGMPLEWRPGEPVPPRHGAPPDPS